MTIIRFIFKMYIQSIILTWIYILLFPIINKFLKLKEKEKLILDDWKFILLASIIPIFNLFATLSAILEDIELYRKKRR